MFRERAKSQRDLFFARWRGASAELWQLTYSHKTLRIVLRRDGDAGNLLISCIDPLRLHSPVRWSGSDITISRYSMPDETHDGFVIVDKNADVEIVFGALEVKENVKLY